MNPADHDPERITKTDKDFSKRLDFKDIKFPIKTRDIHNIEEKNSINISVFGYEKLGNISKKCFEEKHVDSLLTEENGKRHYVYMKDFNTFMYNHTFHRQKSIFVVIIYKISVQKKY